MGAKRARQDASAGRMPAHLRDEFYSEGMIIDLALLAALIVCNGALAMSEIAVVSSRRARLLQLAEAGRPGARRALQLGAEPTRFLSTVQVGITGIGILTGALGEAVVASRFRDGLQTVPALAPYAEPLSLALMVGVVTYVSLIVGELVPKRLALTRPEAIASAVAAPMLALAAVARPAVLVLTASTDAVLRLLGARKVKEPVVTLEEIKVLIEQGTEEGVFERSEQEMVTNVLRLDDRCVGAILTPRSEIVFLDAQKPLEWNRDRLRASSHAVLPLCDGNPDTVVGCVRAADVLNRLLDEARVDLRGLARAPLFVPRTMTLMTLLEQFRMSHLPMAIVVDEFGDVDGLVTLTDVMTAIVGELPPEPGEEPRMVRRADGSWLVDGTVNVEEAARALGVALLADGEEREHYHTLGGMVMFVLGRVPHTGDVFERQGLRFEVVDMDGNRVDRVLVTKPPAT
jgi:putative hemolysin